jgi:hypothetical protein
MVETLEIDSQKKKKRKKSTLYKSRYLRKESLPSFPKTGSCKECPTDVRILDSFFMSGWYKIISF